MADTNQRPTTVGAAGAVTVRQRPSVMLMKVHLRGSEATVELGLTRLKKLFDETAQRLKRLGADRVAAGAPHHADQAPKDAMSAARAAVARVRPGRRGEPPGKRRQDVDLILTATWPIETLSAEEILLLVDRLRFEAAEETGRAEHPEDEPPPWAAPEEQVRQMMARMNEPFVEDRSPKFLFITRPAAEQMQAALADAVAIARKNAERLARAAGMRLGRLSSLQAAPAMISRSDQLMERQRCLGILAGCEYDLKDDEIVSETPCPAEFTIGVNVQCELE